MSRTEAAKLDAKLEELASKTDDSFRNVGLAMQALRDQMDATNQTVTQLREDLRETTRTLQGRARLLEDRFGKMLDLVEVTVADAPTRIDLEELAERVQALEHGRNPAA